MSDILGPRRATVNARSVNCKKPNVMAYSVRTLDFRDVEWREPDNSNPVV
ncbi:MAG: hypothetical protein P8J37_06330 [Fuerstiella sp.]|nr:hypothetical protein [Fuerstiella sp.]